MIKLKNIIDEGQYFQLMGMRFDVDTALLLIHKKGIKVKNINIKDYAEKSLGLDRNKPEHNHTVLLPTLIMIIYQQFLKID